MTLSGAWLYGAVVAATVIAFAWIVFFLWLSRKAVPAKSTPKTVFIGAVGQMVAICNLSIFLLFGVPYRYDLPIITKLLYIISVHVFLFWTAFNYQRRAYFLKLSAGQRQLGWQRNTILLVLFATLATLTHQLHPLPWYQHEDPVLQWYPLFIQLYFVMCNCMMVWYVWVLARAKKFDVYCKKTVVGSVERQGDVWVETLVDGGVTEVKVVPNVCVEELEKKVPLD